jgi:hypothetical protein
VRDECPVVAHGLWELSDMEAAAGATLIEGDDLDERGHGQRRTLS